MELRDWSNGRLLCWRGFWRRRIIIRGILCTGLVVAAETAVGVQRMGMFMRRQKWQACIIVGRDTTPDTDQSKYVVKTKTASNYLHRCKRRCTNMPIPLLQVLVEEICFVLVGGSMAFERSEDESTLLDPRPMC